MVYAHNRQATTIVSEPSISIRNGGVGDGLGKIEAKLAELEESISKEAPAGPRRQGRKLLFLCAALWLVSVFASFFLAGDINSFFKGILGEETQKKLEAPFVEELLKPLGLIILAAVFWSVNRLWKAGIDWLKSMKVCYAIGYASGFVIGVLENWITYKKFSGLRAATPFSHALGAGIVGVGIYYVLTRGKRGLGRFVFLYSTAVLLHLAWNNIEFSVARAVLGLFETVIGFVAFLLSLLAKLGKPSGAFQISEKLS